MSVRINAPNNTHRVSEGFSDSPACSSYLQRFGCDRGSGEYFTKGLKACVCVCVCVCVYNVPDGVGFPRSISVLLGTNLCQRGSAALHVRARVCVHNSVDTQSAVNRGV